MSSIARTRGRPRDAELDRRLLRAAQDALIDDGFERMTVENVAERCAAGKTTVYRRWSTKLDLVVAAVTSLYDVPVTPDTGALRTDLVASFALYLREDSRSQRVLAGLAAGMAKNPPLRDAAYEAIGGPFRVVIDEVLQRWVSRGEVAQGSDLELIGQVFPALAFQRLATLGTTVDQSFIERIVDNVVLPALTGLR
ncbi:MAG: hypothetical protein RI885_1165 [Actinomycetota bacterium]